METGDPWVSAAGRLLAGRQIWPLQAAAAQRAQDAAAAEEEAAAAAERRRRQMVEPLER